MNDIYRVTSDEAKPDDVKPDEIRPRSIYFTIRPPGSVVWTTSNGTDVAAWRVRPDGTLGPIAIPDALLIVAASTYNDDI